MRQLKTTCWTMIHAAADGAPAAREAFALRYAPAVRAYLIERWRGPPHFDYLEDALQEVFVECLRQGGVLERHGQIKNGSFRRFFLGAVRNVALRFEERVARRRECQPTTEFDFDEVMKDDDRLSVVFDRAWAKSLLREAVDRMAHRALRSHEATRRRVKILHLRFYEDLPIREIARRWNMPGKAVHRMYARALDEFQAVLREVVAFHCPDSLSEARREFDLLVGFFS